LTTSSYGGGTLPKVVRSRMIHEVNGLDVHILEAGYESPGRPLALLLHGFPDLAYGWRHLIQFWLTPATMSSRPTSGVLAAPPVG
jgi:hypothetical protein